MPMHECEMSTPTIRGRAAYISGARPDNCPYAPGSTQHLEWLAAWIHEDDEFGDVVVALVHERGRISR